MSQEYTTPRPFAYELCFELFEAGFPQPPRWTNPPPRYIKYGNNSRLVYQPTVQEIFDWIHMLTRKDYRERATDLHTRWSHGRFVCTSDAYPNLEGTGETIEISFARLAIAIERSQRPTPRDRGNVTPLKKQR